MGLNRSSVAIGGSGTRSRTVAGGRYGPPALVHGWVAEHRRRGWILQPDASGRAAADALDDGRVAEQQGRAGGRALVRRGWGVVAREGKRGAAGSEGQGDSDSEGTNGACADDRGTGPADEDVGHAVTVWPRPARWRP